LTVARSKISAREYKVLLRADRFSGDEIAIADAAAAFWRGLRGASEASSSMSTVASRSESDA
jgi:hypothetical protein